MDDGQLSSSAGECEDYVDSDGSGDGSASDITALQSTLAMLGCLHEHTVVCISALQSAGALSGSLDEQVNSCMQWMGNNPHSVLGAAGGGNGGGGAGGGGGGGFVDLSGGESKDEQQPKKRGRPSKPAGGVVDMTGGDDDQEDDDGPPTSSFVEGLEFGPRAFRDPAGRGVAVQMSEIRGGRVNQKVQQIVLASVPEAATMMGQRGQCRVIDMLCTIHQSGLFTLGGPESPTNREVVPSIRHIFFELQSIPDKDLRRVAIVQALCDACIDCQQVQAREIMRIFMELTNQVRGEREEREKRWGERAGEEVGG